MEPAALNPSTRIDCALAFARDSSQVGVRSIRFPTTGRAYSNVGQANEFSLSLVLPMILEANAMTATFGPQLLGQTEKTLRALLRRARELYEAGRC